MSNVLEYARASTPAPARRWPLILVAVIALVAGVGLLAQNCAFGIRHVADAGHAWREEAWGRVLGTGSGCLLTMASGCGLARRAGFGTVVMRRVMGLGIAIWLTSCVIMVVRMVW